MIKYILISFLVLNCASVFANVGYVDFDQVLKKTKGGKSIKERETHGEIGVGVNYQQRGEKLGSVENFGVEAFLRQNIFGLDQTIRGSVNLNFVTTSLNVQYIDPHIFDSDWYASFEVLYENSKWSQSLRTNLKDYLNDSSSSNKTAQNNLENSSEESETNHPYLLLSGRPYTIERRGFRFALGYWLKDKWKILPNVGFMDVNMRELAESISIGLGSSVRENFQLDASEGFRALIGGSVEYNGKNDSLFPTEGIHTRLVSDYIYKFPSSEFHAVNLFKIDGSFSHYVNLQDLFSYLNLSSFKWANYLAHVTLKNKVQYGHVISLDSNSFIPVDLLYLLGGPLDLRGYSLLSIGKSIRIPRPNGELPPYSVPYGGAQQWVYNLELQFPILLRSRLYGMLFFDVGQADDLLFQKIFKKGWSILKKDVGVGVSWASPIGPLHLKLGFPIGDSQKDFFEDKEFHFNISYDF